MTGDRYPTYPTLTASEQSAELSRWSYDQPAPRVQKRVVPEWVKLMAYDEIEDTLRRLTWALQWLALKDGMALSQAFDAFVNAASEEWVAPLEWAIRIANGGE